jgi:lysyl-tRNA synthetase class 1
MPVPIFYEHILINGEKMSASKGNVIYPKDWLEVADPEILRFFYNKRLMKTRSFSWRDLPEMYDEYDKHMLVYFNKIESKNEKEKNHMKRLFEISQLKKPVFVSQIPYSFAGLIAQMCKPEEGIERAVKLLKFTGHIKSLTKKEKTYLQKRLLLAKNWTEKYAPAELKIQLNEHAPEGIKRELSADEKNAIKSLVNWLKGKLKEEDIQTSIYEIARENSIEPRRFFWILYHIILSRDSGPRLGPFIIVIGKGKVIRLLEEII